MSRHALATTLVALLATVVIVACVVHLHGHPLVWTGGAR